MEMIALEPLCGDHEPQRVRAGERFYATDEVAHYLMATARAVPAAYLADDQPETEERFVQAAQALTSQPRRRRS